MITKQEFKQLTAPLGWTAGTLKNMWEMEKRLMEQMPLPDEQERQMLQSVIQTTMLRRELGS